MNVIILSVSNDGGDDGSYNGNVIGVFERLYEVEELSEEWMKEKSKELYFVGDDDEEVECCMVVCGDDSYDGCVDIDGMMYCFKIVEVS